MTSEFPPQPGGIGTHAYHLATYLEIEGYAVQVIADQRSKTGEEEKTFDSVVKFRVHRVVLRKLRFLMYLKRIVLLFRQLKGAEVVIASGKFSLWNVAFASLFYKRNYVAVIHGTEVNFTNRILKTTINLSLKRFSKLIAVSNFTKDLVKHLHHNIEVIPNGIAIDDLTKHQVQVMDLKGQPSLLTVGNVSDRKGQLQVIKLLPELLKHYPDLHYHCVGLPTQQAEFLKTAQALDIADHLTFHGRVPDASLYDFLASADIFVMLSSTTKTGDVEGFGIALLEANYFGLPCIGATNCGIEDAIDDHTSGRLISTQNIEAFKAAIEDVLRDKARYQKDAKVWALQHSWEHIVKRYIKALAL